jgi:hypothetical protein
MIPNLFTVAIVAAAVTDPNRLRSVIVSEYSVGENRKERNRHSATEPAAWISRSAAARQPLDGLSIDKICLIDSTRVLFPPTDSVRLDAIVRSYLHYKTSISSGLGLLMPNDVMI